MFGDPPPLVSEVEERRRRVLAGLHGYESHGHQELQLLGHAGVLGHRGIELRFLASGMIADVEHGGDHVPLLEKPDVLLRHVRSLSIRVG